MQIVWQCQNLVKAGLHFIDPRNYSGKARIIRSVSLLGVIGILLLSILIPLISNYISSQRYVLSMQSKQLLDPVQSTLAERFTYEAKDKAYYFNKKGLDAAPAPSTAPTNQAGPNPAAALKQLQAQVGGGANKKDKSLYSVQLPDDPSQGITYYDNNLSLNFKLTPQGQQYAPKLSNGRLVYPAKTGAQAIYSAKGNGLKEDIILKESQGDSLQYDYKLQLPKELEARLTEEGGLGIYSADPAYFGNISYGSADDEARVMAARTEGKKDHLVFALPAPVIHQTGKSGQGTAKADFSLDGDTLSVKAGNLNTLSYPITIDPSVVITSATDFQTGNNEDGNIDFTTAGQIGRSSLTGGSVGTWAATTAIPTARIYQAAVTYNGFLYTLGGSPDGSTEFNDVQYSAIGVNGTLGAWATTTAFTTGRQGLTAAAYNGYMYVIGGYDGATTYYNDVQYAPINANGTLGVWASTSAYTNARESHTTVAYNSYLYIIGGSNGVNLNDVQYAPINANGTLGTWATTTAFTTARSGHASVVYNGYLYVIGGFASSVANDVQYAPLNANGTVGSWSTSTAFTTARTRLTSVVYNGYLYIIGGYDGVFTYYNDVQYAPINANGSIGTWTTTNPFTTARFGHISAAYNGYIYVVGGSNGTAQTSSQYVKIDQPGTIKSFAASANSPATARAWGSAVAMGGYLYLIGGCTAVTADTCSTASTLVSFAAIAADGSVGVWANTTNALPAARGMGAAVGYQGRLYYVGGRPTSTTVSNTIYYTTVSSATGNTTAIWTAVTPTGYTASWGHTATIYNDNLYILGGCTSTAVGCTAFTNTVQVAKLATAGGLTTNPNCANNICPLTTFTTARWGASSTVNGGYVYIYGGLHATSDTLCNATASTVCSDIQYAAISATGSLGAWSTTTSALTAAYGTTLTVVNGYLYVSSGKTSTTTFVATTSYAKVNANGTIATDSGCAASWCASTNAPVGRGGSAGVAAGTSVYLVSGQDTSTTVTALDYVATINNGGSGQANAWATTTAFTTTKNSHSSVAYRGFLYIMGGSNTIDYNDVQYAPINANGTIGTWAATTSFTGVRYGHSSIAYNGYMYIIGGTTGTTYYNDVQYAPINANGTIGTWNTTAAFTTGRYYHSSAMYNGYLYIVGGSNAGSPVSDVQYALINNDGTIGAWSTTTSLPVTRTTHTSVAYNGYLYAIGGYDGLNTISDIQYASINANGSIGAWAATTSLPGPRSSHTTIAENGYLYVIGGSSPANLSDVQYASINANGSIGTWAKSSSFTNARYSHTSAFYNGYIYVIGGYTTVSQNDVQYSLLNAINRTARYSKLIDLGTTTTLSNISFTGSLPGNKESITYKLAGTNGVLGASLPASGLSGTCVAGGTTRYVLFTVLLDNSGVSPFPDSSTTNIQDFTINYSTTAAGGGVLPISRLRGGKTVDQATGQSVLDIAKIYPGGGAVCT